MKNLSLSVLMAFLCLFTTALAQNLTVIKPEICKFTPAAQYATDVFEGTDGTHYLYSYAVERDKGMLFDRLCTLNAENGTSSETSWNYPNDYSYVTGFENEDGVVLFYEKYDKKDGFFTLCSNVVEAGHARWQPKTIASFACERRDDVQYESAVSPDKKLLAICMQQSKRAGDFKGTMVFVFDNQGDVIWQKEIELQFHNMNFGLIDIAVDNDGMVYASYYSYNEGFNKKRENNLVSVYEVTENETSVQERNVDFCLASACMSLGQKGMLHIGGYTATDVKKNADGTFLIDYDVRNSQFVTASQLDFSGYKETVIGGILAGYYANQDYYIVPTALYEYSDGTVGLLGEQRTITRVTDQAGITYYYFVKNLILTRSDTQGNIDLVNLYERKAISYHFTPILSYPFFKDDKIYMLFNDHTNNYTQHKHEAVKFYKVGLGTVDLVMMTIDEKGNENRDVIYHGKPAKNCILRPLFMENDGFSVIALDKKYAHIAKLKVPFEN